MRIEYAQFRKVVNQTRPCSIIAQPVDRSLIELFQVMCEKTGQCGAFLDASIQCYQNDPIGWRRRRPLQRFISQFRGQHARQRRRRQARKFPRRLLLLSLFSGLHMTTAMLPPQSVSYHVVVVVVMNDRGNSIAPNLDFPLNLPFLGTFPENWRTFSRLVCWESYVCQDKSGSMISDFGIKFDSECKSLEKFY